ncbi:MAG: glycosyl hydrolase 108 family protein [Pseudomonadota bacterium]
MAASSYEVALTRLLKDEGGYGDHPSDPGGPTNFGITLADARRYWKGNASAADVRAMPESVARKIYRERYWNAMRCDELPAGVDYAVFDYGVNSGIGRAGKVLRRVLKLADPTGAVTDDVVAAASRADAVALVKSICAERLAFLKSLKTFSVFGRGWTARVNGVLAASLKLAGPQRPQLPVPRQTDAAPGKAVVPPSSPASTAATGAVIAAGGAAAATSRIEIALLVAGAAAVAALAIFLIWRRRHRAAQEAAVKGAANELG